MSPKRYTGNVRLDGKTVIITGGNAGIGRATAKDLYKRGARVVILSRNEEKSLQVLEEIRNECKQDENVGALAQKYLDLGDLASVRACAKALLEEEKQINILINNAGVMGVREHKTKDGLETHFAVNHLGHFLLTLLLLPRILKSAPARIINVSSVAYDFPFFGNGKLNFDVNFEHTKYNQNRAYGQSKLANIMFAIELARRLNKLGFNNVTTYSLNPGVVATEAGRNFDVYMKGLSWIYKRMSGFFFATPDQGAQTTLYCALDEELAKKSGLYYNNCQETQVSRHAYDDEALEKLWKISEDLVKLDKEYNPFDIQNDNHSFF